MDHKHLLTALGWSRNWRRDLETLKQGGSICEMTVQGMMFDRHLCWIPRDSEG
jgi:hypothetical protein